MLAHIKAGQVISEYNEGKGRVTFGNGSTVSPPTAGVYGDEQYGFEQLVPIVVVTVDNSTTARTTSTSVDTVEADRVLRTVTISDMPIEAIRAGTSIGKGEFCKGLIGLDIIAADEAVLASRGNWPASMDAFLSYLPADQAISVQIDWATEATINRNNVFVLTLGSWLDDVTPEILDTLFGINGA
jgi:hypothetical protein